LFGSSLQFPTQTPTLTLTQTPEAAAAASMFAGSNPTNGGSIFSNTQQQFPGNGNLSSVFGGGAGTANPNGQ
jgi:hypothetical protein